MSEAPEKIWLQWEGEYHEETTWCVDQIEEDDVEYIRLDIAKGLFSKPIEETPVEHRYSK